MELTPEAIRDFQDAYFADFGEEISEEEAEEMGMSLIRLMKIVYQPIPKNYSTTDSTP